jgi:hypothetical protein
MRKWIAVLAAAAATVMFGSLAPALATESPYCGIRWGSLAKSQNATSTAPLTNVRAGRHACYDRLVLDFRGDSDGYRVEYVSAVAQDGSGAVVPLRGGAKLRIIAEAPAYDANGNATYVPGNRSELVNVSGYSTFRQVAWAGSFEGRTTIGLGVRARLPFRVFTLDGPGSGSRLVIDVAHRW